MIQGVLQQCTPAIVKEAKVNLQQIALKSRFFEPLITAEQKTHKADTTNSPFKMELLSKHPQLAALNNVDNLQIDKLNSIAFKYLACNTFKQKNYFLNFIAGNLYGIADLINASLTSLEDELMGPALPTTRLLTLLNIALVPIHPRLVAAAFKHMLLNYSAEQIQTLLIHSKDPTCDKILDIAQRLTLLRSQLNGVGTEKIKAAFALELTNTKALLATAKKQLEEALDIELELGLQRIETVATQYIALSNTMIYNTPNVLKVRFYALSRGLSFANDTGLLISTTYSYVSAVRNNIQQERTALNSAISHHENKIKDLEKILAGTEATSPEMRSIALKYELDGILTAIDELARLTTHQNLKRFNIQMALIATRDELKKYRQQQATLNEVNAGLTQARHGLDTSYNKVAYEPKLMAVVEYAKKNNQPCFAPTDWVGQYYIGKQAASLQSFALQEAATITQAIANLECKEASLQGQLNRLTPTTGELLPFTLKYAGSALCLELTYDPVAFSQEKNVYELLKDTITRLQVKTLSFSNEMALTVNMLKKLYELLLNDKNITQLRFDLHALSEEHCQVINQWLLGNSCLEKISANNCTLNAACFRLLQPGLMKNQLKEALFNQNPLDDLIAPTLKEIYNSNVKIALQLQNTQITATILGEQPNELPRLPVSIDQLLPPHMSLEGTKIVIKKIEGQALEKLRAILAECNQVVELHFSAVMLQNEECQQLNALLLQNSCIKYINLSCCQLNAERFALLLPGLSQPHIKKILLENNPLGTHAIASEQEKWTEQLQTWLMAASGLRELNLNNTALSPEAYCAIAQWLFYATIEYLSLAQNTPNSEALSAVAKALQNNPPLKKLNLSANHLDDEKILFLISHLTSNFRLKTLLLSHNNIGDNACEEMLPTLFKLACHDPHQLTTIDLSYNQISLLGAKQIAMLLENCPKMSLKELSLLGNPIIGEIRGKLLIAANKCRQKNPSFTLYL